MLIEKSKRKRIRCFNSYLDICVYVHVIKVIRCEYNNRGRVKLDKLGGGGGGGGRISLKVEKPCTMELM